MKNNGKLMEFLKNKNTVVALCAIIAVAVLVVGYQVRVNQATMPVEIPYAAVEIKPRTQITGALIAYKKVPREALGGSFYNKNEMEALIARGNLYSNVNTVIPAGSLIYKTAAVTREQLPDSSLFSVKEGETLYYLPVNMLTSYQNSILPDSYIDLYVSYRNESQAVVGRLFTNIKVLAVKTSDGQNVFEDNEEKRVPSIVLFAVEESNHLILREIEAITKYGLGNINVYPVPVNERKNHEVQVNQDQILEWIQSRATSLQEFFQTESDTEKTEVDE